MSDLNVENQQQTNVVVSTPTMQSEVYHATKPRTLFGGLGGYQGGDAESVKEPFSKDANKIASSCVEFESLKGAQRSVSPMVMRLQIGEVYGDVMHKEGKPIKFGAMELRVNSIRSDSIPLYGENAERALHTFITNMDVETRHEVYNWFIQRSNWEALQALVNGVNPACLSTREGGLGFQYVNGDRGQPFMCRNIWHSDTSTTPKDVIVDLDWNTHCKDGTGNFRVQAWNDAVQTEYIDKVAALTGNNGKLNLKKLWSIRKMLTRKGFRRTEIGGANVVGAFLVSPEDVMLLREELKDNVQIPSSSTIEQLRFFGCNDSFIYNDLLVSGHDDIWKMRPKVGLTNAWAPVFGTGEQTPDDWYVSDSDRTVQVGFVLASKAIKQADGKAVRFKAQKGDWELKPAILAEFDMGAARQEFFAVANNTNSRVDYTDPANVYNNASAVVFYKAAE